LWCRILSEKYVCIVCGRKFPKGQGIVLVIDGKVYPFHSKACALKFLRRFLEEVDKSLVINIFDKLSKEFEEERIRKLKLKAKKI